MVRDWVGTEMDVIDMKATGLLVVGGRVNMARPGQGGNQQEPQDHGSKASHSENYMDRARPGQAAQIRSKRMRTRGVAIHGLLARFSLVWAERRPGKAVILFPS